MKKALITGISGQDGSYLAEFLLEKGYEVHGIIQYEENNDKLWRIQHILDQIVLHSGKIDECESIEKIIFEVNPEEIYHLASQHEVKNTRENYKSIFSTNVDSLYYTLSCIKDNKLKTRLFFASSSRVFVGGIETPQNELTPMYPTSLYGITKTAGVNLVRMFREQEGLFACSGFLFNHESPRRDVEFLTRKISKAVAEIKKGSLQELRLGDLDARRDWGFARDYVGAMWMMLQQEKPEDYIIGTGETHSVRDFLDFAFGFVGLNWKEYIKIDPDFVRPKELELCADINKAKKQLGWVPKVRFKELVEMMVEEDLRLI
ncbi:MAG: GDP-mannose 4,6-dehydratase [Patescibacteria group bacterium]